MLIFTVSPPWGVLAYAPVLLDGSFSGRYDTYLIPDLALAIKRTLKYSRATEGPHTKEQVMTMAKRRKVSKGERSNTVGEKTLDEKLAKAMGHPVRAQIISYLEKNGVSSPKEMAQAGLAEEKLPNVAYHVRILEEYGCVELVEEESVRGSTAHFYRATTRMLLDIDAWRKLNKSTKKAVSIVAVQETIEGVSEAMEQDTFDSFDERNVMNLRRQVDKKGFLAASQKMHEFMEWFDELEEECLKRSQGDEGEDLFPMSVNMLLYEAPRAKKS